MAALAFGIGAVLHAVFIAFYLLIFGVDIIQVCLCVLLMCFGGFALSSLLCLISVLVAGAVSRVGHHVRGGLRVAAAAAKPQTTPKPT